MRLSWAMCKQFLTPLVLLTLIVSLSSFPAFSQATIATGAIQGTVTDQSDAVVPGASVTIKNVATAQTVTRTTNGSGVYNSGPLSPGDYTVSVQAGGFGRREVATAVTRLASRRLARPSTALESWITVGMRSNDAAASGGSVG